MYIDLQNICSSAILQLSLHATLFVPTQVIDGSVEHFVKLASQISYLHSGLG